MKKILIILCIGLLSLMQSPGFGKQKTYKAIITAMDNSKTTGIIQEVLDSAILLIMDNQVIKFRAKEIKSIIVKCSNCMGKNILIGGLTGAAIGVVAGLISGDNGTGMQYMSAGENAAVYGATLGIIGGIGGAIVSMAEVKYKINGDQEAFQTNILKMKKYELSMSK